MQRTVVLFSIDGMRPDALRLADTPTIDSLRDAGAWTDKARTVMPSVTLPCHTSMLRGVDVPRHGITTNIFIPLARPVPSLFDVAYQQGKRCGAFTNWGELRDLFHPGSVAVHYCVNASQLPEDDAKVAREAIEHHEEEPFDFLFVYLGRTDSMGHAHGWMSEPYIDAISHADTCVKMVLDALNASGRIVTALVQSDHGGHERTHGTEMDEDMLIPWILSGEGVKPGELCEEVRIFDTCPTLAHLLGLTPAKEWDGRIVKSALA